MKDQNETYKVSIAVLVPMNATGEFIAKSEEEAIEKARALWNSHGAQAFGLDSVDYEDREVQLLGTEPVAEIV